MSLRLLAVVCFAAAAAAAAAAPTPVPASHYCHDVIAPIPDLPTDGYLRSVAVFIRHGDRTRAAYSGPCWADDDAVYNCSLGQWTANAPTPTLPSTGPAFRLQFEPGFEELPGSCGIGELTTKGNNQQLGNGKAIADAYVKQAKLLSPKLNTSELYLRSDNSHRTIMSGQALVTGMYPDATDAYPAFFIRDPEYENIYPNAGNCPALTDAAEAVVASSEYKALIASLKPLAANLSEALGQSYADETAILNVFDCYFTHVCHGYPVPSVLNGPLGTELEDAITQYQVLMNTYNNSRYARYGTSSLVSDVLHNFDAVVSGDAGSTLKFHLFSGHDTGPIFPLLFAFGVYDNAWPPYASRISMELWETSAGWAVRMEYNGKVVYPCGTTNGGLCDWDTFRAKASSIANSCPAPQRPPAPPSK